MLTPPDRDLRVGGLVPLTTLDWPDHLSAVIFTQGCGWRCRYCHNPDLLPARGMNGYSWHGVLDFLETRRGLLDGVVFSGGDPLFQLALADAIDDVRALGFDVALHTGGANPAALARILPALSWVGFDIKALPGDYDALTGVRGSGGKAQRSLELLIDSGVPFECRTTVHWQLTDTGRLLQLARQLATRGVRHYTLQLARAGVMFDPTLGDNLVPDNFHALVSTLEGMFEHFSVRR